MNIKVDFFVTYKISGATRSIKMTQNVVIETTMGAIEFELYTEHAPRTCRNFATLAERGYYNDCPIHRVIPNFMVQTGDPTGTGRGGSSIYGEKFEDEIRETLRHTGAGILSMANAGPNTNGSQFFITLAPTPWLDGKHTIFGRVKSGLRVVQRLGLVKTDKEDRPVDGVKITSARIAVLGALSRLISGLRRSFGFALPAMIRSQRLFATLGTAKSEAHNSVQGRTTCHSLHLPEAAVIISLISLPPTTPPPLFSILNILVLLSSFWPNASLQSTTTVMISRHSPSSNASGSASNHALLPPSTSFPFPSIDSPRCSSSARTCCCGATNTPMVAAMGNPLVRKRRASPTASAHSTVWRSASHHARGSRTSRRAASMAAQQQSNRLLSPARLMTCTEGYSAQYATTRSLVVSSSSSSSAATAGVYRMRRSSTSTRRDDSSRRSRRAARVCAVVLGAPPGKCAGLQPVASSTLGTSRLRPASSSKRLVESEAVLLGSYVCGGLGTSFASRISALMPQTTAVSPTLTTAEPAQCVREPAWQLGLRKAAGIRPLGRMGACAGEAGRRCAVRYGMVFVASEFGFTNAGQLRAHVGGQRLQWSKQKDNQAALANGMAESQSGREKAARWRRAGSLSAEAQLQLRLPLPISLQLRQWALRRPFMRQANGATARSSVPSCFVPWETPQGADWAQASPRRPSSWPVRITQQTLGRDDRTREQPMPAAATVPFGSSVPSPSLLLLRRLAGPDRRCAGLSKAIACPCPVAVIVLFLLLLLLLLHRRLVLQQPLRFVDQQLGAACGKGLGFARTVNPFRLPALVPHTRYYIPPIQQHSSWKLSCRLRQAHLANAGPAAGHLLEDQYPSHVLSVCDIFRPESTSMPSLPTMLASDASSEALVSLDNIPRNVLLAPTSTSWTPTLVERVNVPFNTKFGTTNPPGLVEAMTRDPWSQSGKYALGWLYFSIILLAATIGVRMYTMWTDKIRTASYKDRLLQQSVQSTPEMSYEMAFLDTDKSTNKLFPRTDPAHMQQDAYAGSQSSISSIAPLNNLISAFRYVFYRPIPNISLGKNIRPITFPSLAVCCIVFAALAFTIMYTFIPQPLYWQSLAFGSPPVAIRSGMLAVSMMPWIVLLSMKANIISMITGIGHERLNVLHRWGGWLCLLLSLIHTVPFYVAKMNDPAGYAYYRTLLSTPSGIYLFGTGFAALAPLIFLCLHGIHHLRHAMYELFVTLHVPVSIVFLAMLIWHCNNYITSWNYLWATLAIWGVSYIIRLFYLNWANPWRMSSFLIGDEAGVYLLPENAVKVTIPTQMKWKPGQYVYLRMPGVSLFENHPFTITSLCSDDFPSEYGEGYRDMVLVFRPFGGFTKKVLEKATEKGPWHSYRAFVDGPYGGMKRSLDAFDHVILFAGGSGITALTSHLLDLIKRMRDGKAVTKTIQVVWAIKRPETMEWFREELRIAREYAPPGTVQCQFYITAAKRLPAGQLVSASTPGRPVSMFFNDKVNDAFQSIANKRSSHYSEVSRHSALIRDEAMGDPHKEQELRKEQEDKISPLPKGALVPATRTTTQPPPEKQYLAENGELLYPPVAPPAQYQQYFGQQYHGHEYPNGQGQQQKQRQQGEQTGQKEDVEQEQPEIQQPEPTHYYQSPKRQRNLAVDVEQATRAGALPEQAEPTNYQGFDFGFPSTPTEFQKNLMRFAFLPAAVKRQDGWSTEYGRPDIPYMLRQAKKDFGRRTCVFVCGPPSMRLDVSYAVADLQREILNDPLKDELYLHTENYAI
ncbi:hypothetical protein FH972_021310 [Carpinus fangiana]|uniref:Uncharacterized protein n=1 Tax=Carpinus fangiana TaxID=176857 RepID=A0A5N6KPD3_9ROSI|nr:hypothetical protein FH972_021310 [Carpinus fangiana]